MTIKDLRDKIASLPDDAPVYAGNGEDVFTAKALWSEEAPALIIRATMGDHLDTAELSTLKEL